MERGAQADDTEAVVSMASRIEEAENILHVLEVEDIVAGNIDGSRMAYSDRIAARRTHEPLRGFHDLRLAHCPSEDAHEAGVEWML